jgi:hypothetical protein
MEARGQEVRVSSVDSEVAAHAVERDVLGAFDDDFLHNRAALE